MLWNDLKDSPEREEQAIVADIKQHLSSVTVIVINVETRTAGTELSFFSRVVRIAFGRVT